MQERIKSLPAREMHKYVLGLVGLWVLFGVTFSIACIRVSQDKKFADARFHLKSMTLEGKWEQSPGTLPDAQPVANNSSAKAASSAATDNKLQLIGVADSSKQAQAADTTVVTNPDAQAFSSGATDNKLQLAGVADNSKQIQVVNTTSQKAAISDRQQLRLLNQKLYQQIAKDWQPGQKLFERKLVYRVSMSQDGVIGSYKPVNQAASDYIQDTPLSNWLDDSSARNNTSVTQQQLVDFEVVFTPQGILQVTPWDGWN
jgi:hypothetical protein